MLQFFINHLESRLFFFSGFIFVMLEFIAIFYVKKILQPVIFLINKEFLITETIINYTNKVSKKIINFSLLKNLTLIIKSEKNAIKSAIKKIFITKLKNQNRKKNLIFDIFEFNVHQQ